MLQLTNALGEESDQGYPKPGYRKLWELRRLLYRNFS
jgi:hypothetical protein